MHLLIAIEQVLALIESFHPRGPGAAAAVLPEAARSARARIAPAAEPE